MDVKIYKMVIQVFENEGISLQEVIDEVERSKFVSIIVREHDVREIKDFTDDHPINKTVTAKEIFDKMFQSLPNKDFPSIKYMNYSTIIDYNGNIINE